MAKTIRLGPKDAAIVFRTDGEEEIIHPEGKEHELVGQPVINVLICAYAIHDPASRAFIESVIRGKRDQLNREENADGGSESKTPSG